MDTKEFIERAKKIHGNKYDYSKVEYKNINTKVKIICPIHGEFEQLPKSHLDGHGCRLCSNGTLSKEQFIKKAREIHGDKYDYSQVEYVNNKTKVAIICPEHGVFMQVPYLHLKGEGCCHCGHINGKNKQRKTSEQFIEEMKNIYGDKYDYSKVKYVNNHTKVCIICHEKDDDGIEHGEFYTLPLNILRGKECPKCKNHIKLDTETFIKKAKKVHGNKYDYSESVVNGVDNKTKIICPEHGEFYQTPYKHINSMQGCPICGKKKVGEKSRNSEKDVIENAKKVHGNKYDYSKSKYDGIDKKMLIICPKHGEFYQTPYAHINLKCGCPKCKRSTLEEKIINLLDDNGIKYEYRKRNLPFLNGLEADFYLPNEKIIIECQGIQHFKPIIFGKYGFGKAKKDFEMLVLRDKEKKRKCDENGIKILYYSDIKFEFPYNVYTSTEQLLTTIKENG